MPWTYRDGERDKATTDEIDRQEDRAAAIIASAYVEDRLALAIKARLIADIQVTNPMFNGDGPLATFSVKINMAYLLGLITKRQRETLHIIKKIRNLFAHDLSPLTFTSQNIQALCRNLHHDDNIASLRQLMGVMAQQNPKINFMTFFEQWFAVVESEKQKPRETYMNNVQIILLQIELLGSHSRFIVSLLSPLPGKSVLHSPPAPQNENRTR
jgi:DNA-binding MltR family transcriptional regulator